MWFRTVLRVAVVTALLHAPVAQAQPSSPTRHPAGEVRAVFAGACAGCHGADLPKPQGRFGYVLDLRRVADNPEMVIPCRPEESELWQLVRRGEMPPPDAPTGPLTAAQKEVVRKWIELGCPVEPPEPVEEVLLPSAHDLPEPPAPREYRRGLIDLAALHLAILSVLLGLLVSAVVGTWWAVRRGKTGPTAVHFCVLLGTVAVVSAAVIGWLQTGPGYPAEQSAPAAYPAGSEPPRPGGRLW